MILYMSVLLSPFDVMLCSCRWTRPLLRSADTSSTSAARTMITFVRMLCGASCPTPRTPKQMCWKWRGRCWQTRLCGVWLLLDAAAMQILLELCLSALLFCCREGNAGSRICKGGHGFPCLVDLTAFIDLGLFLALKSALQIAGSGTKFWSTEGWALAHCS